MKKFTLKDILSSAAKWEPPEKREPTPKKVAQSEKKPVKPAKIPEKTDYSRVRLYIFCRRGPIDGLFVSFAI